MDWREERETLKLHNPVAWGETQVTELKFRPLMAKDLMGFQVDSTGKMNMGDFLDLAGKCVDHESGMSIIKELSAKDAMQVVTIMGNALGDGE